MDDLSLEASRRYQGAVSLLYSRARTWWESVVSSVPAIRLTWEFFQEYFRSRYIGEQYTTMMTERFRTLVQGDRTVSEYETEFLDLLRFRSSLVPIEREKYRRFALGLRYELSARVIGF